MKRLARICAIVLALAAGAASGLSADGDARAVTGAAKGLFPGGAALGAVALDGLEVGTGVFIEADGSASGIFHAVLQGTALGQPHRITIEGKASDGSVASDGRATFSGTASLDLGDGMPPLPGVAFSVTTAAQGVVLVIDGTTLPAAGLTAGAVSVE
jgi:hypothetical protein